MSDPVINKVTVKGKGDIGTSDEKAIRWVGKTKSGLAVKITIPRAICKDNIELTMAEKDDIINSLEYEGLYTDAALAQDNKDEPWEIEYLSPAASAETDHIVLGLGKFYVGDADSTQDSDFTCVGLTRGGGSFNVEREFREINADGDPGAVSGRIAKEGGRPKLKLSSLEVTKTFALHAAIVTTTEQVS